MRFGDTLNYVGNFPAAPTDGVMQSIKQAVKKAIGVQLTSSGWRMVGLTVEKVEDNKYQLVIGLRRESGRKFQEEIARKQINEIAARLNLTGWKRIGEGVEEENVISVAELLTLPEDWKEYFCHIYERDLQINEMIRSIEIARDTNMKVRNHVLLYGEPSVGKSEILLSLSNLFGDLAVHRFDATNTTKAGAVDFFLKSDNIPPVVVIEEIDKVLNEHDLSWFLSVMDSRGEIIKTTARTGHRQRFVNPLIIATVNNISKVKSFHEGALLSRFSTPLYCPLPSRDVITKILKDHLEALPNAKEEWIEPAIKFAMEELHCYHPRRIKSILTIGGDRLLDGSYQKEHLELIKQENRDLETISTGAH